MHTCTHANRHVQYNACMLSHVPGNGGSFKLIPKMLHIIEDRLQENEGVTSMQLQKLLKDHGQNTSQSTVIRVNKSRCI